MSVDLTMNALSGSGSAEVSLWESHSPATVFCGLLAMVYMSDVLIGACPVTGLQQDPVEVSR